MRRRRKHAQADGSSQQSAVEIAVTMLGYKNHVGIDRAHGPIRTWTVTHAAAHDGVQLAELLDPANTARTVWADTAYRSAANRVVLDKWAMVPHLQRPKPRCKPMPPHVRRGNASRGKIRAPVEHIIACQKQRLRLVVRTIGRATNELGPANLAYNLRRVSWLDGRTAPA